jgi:AhpD family alkylhydroperoxidase
MFPQHTLETAPPASRRLMETTAKHLGHVPPTMARLAESPEMLSTFLKASGTYEASTLDPVAQEVVVMTIAVRNGCQVCIALHTPRLPADVADALKADDSPADPRLAAIRRFTLALLASTGAVDDAELAAFLDAGYTHRNALEVVLGIGTYTMSTFANRLVESGGQVDLD